MYSKLTWLGYIEKLGILGKNKITFLLGITFFTLNLIYRYWWLGQSPNLNKLFYNFTKGQWVFPFIWTINGSLSSNSNITEYSWLVEGWNDVYKPDYE